jgi:NAD(P)-dependent dehydrogenase (short-subunit alcohol dehydrogenase family)
VFVLKPLAGENIGVEFLSQKSVLITGCSSGIGLASALAMQSRGWRVFATARKQEDLTRLAGLGLEPLPLELRDPASVAACAAVALERTSGNLDALFNNAAQGQPGAVEDLPVELLRDSFEVNLFSWHALTRPILAVMRKRGHGRIVQCSSVLGLISPPWRAAYNSTKFALEALSDAMRHELHGTQVHVSLIEPGPINTRFIEHAMENLRDKIDIENSVHREAYKGRLAAMAKGGKLQFKLGPEAVAAKLVHALESARPKVRYYVTVPTYLTVIGKRVLPRIIGDRLVRNN